MEKSSDIFQRKFEYGTTNPFGRNLLVHLLLVFLAVVVGYSARWLIVEELAIAFPKVNPVRVDHDWGYKIESFASPLGLSEGGAFPEGGLEAYDRIYALAQDEREDRVLYLVGDLTSEDPFRYFYVGPDWSYAWLVERPAPIERDVRGGEILLRSQSDPTVSYRYFDYDGNGVFDMFSKNPEAEKPEFFLRVNGASVSVGRVDEHYLVDGVAHEFRGGDWVAIEN